MGFYRRSRERFSRHFFFCVRRRRKSCSKASKRTWPSGVRAYMHVCIAQTIFDVYKHEFGQVVFGRTFTHRAFCSFFRRPLRGCRPLAALRGADPLRFMSYTTCRPPETRWWCSTAARCRSAALLALLIRTSTRDSIRSL